MNASPVFRASTLALAVAATLSLAACNRNNTDSTTPTTPVPAPTVPATPAPPVTDPTAAAGASGGASGAAASGGATFGIPVPPASAASGPRP